MDTVAPGSGRPSSLVVTTPVRAGPSWATAVQGTSKKARAAATRAKVMGPPGLQLFPARARPDVILRRAAEQDRVDARPRIEREGRARAPVAGGRGRDPPQ